MKDRSTTATRARILAVDDQEAQLIALDAVLGDLGHDLVTARSGQEALELAACEEFAVILLDVSMPGMDGYQTASGLRALASARTTPLIFLTGDAVRTGSPLVAYAAGAVDFLTKPYIPEVLRSKVAVFLELFRIRRDAEQQAELLRQSEEKHRIFTELTSDFTCSLVLGEDGSIALESLSEAFTRVTGHGAADLFSSASERLVHAEDRGAVTVAILRLKRGEPVQGHVRLLTSEGIERHLRYWARPVRTAGGERVARILAAAQDVTEQRKLEDELRQSQKMEAVGRLAGGIAHDFNNMLTVILGNTQLMLGSGIANPLLVDNAEQIRAAAERAASLVAQLLAFSRRQLLQLSTFDLNETVRTMESMLRRVIGEHITLTTQLSPHPLLLHADRGRLEQVVVNLVVNSRDALPHGGTITLETALAERRVMLAVADTGVGMDAKTRAQIFEPFFTTKGMGKGTGLGLAMVHGVVHQSGGQLDVQSEPGRGTTFRIWLPGTAGSASPTSRPEELVASEGGAGTILVVEDEHAVRRLATVSLEQAGYQVLEAGDGQLALEVANAHPGRIDLLLTDVVMPGVTGPELFVKLKALRPELKVLYTSGYSKDQAGKYGFAPDEVSFLSKPFTPSLLKARVKEILP